MEVVAGRDRAACAGGTVAAVLSRATVGEITGNFVMPTVQQTKLKESSRNSSSRPVDGPRRGSNLSLMRLSYPYGGSDGRWDMQPTGTRKPTSQRQRQGAFENTAKMIEDERRRRGEKTALLRNARLAREAKDARS